jgi:hypothetical protein
LPDTKLPVPSGPVLGVSPASPAKAGSKPNMLASSVTASESAARGWIPSLKRRAVATASWRRRPVVLPRSGYVFSKHNASGGCAVEIAARCLQSCKSLQARRAREEQDKCGRDRVGKPTPMHSVPLSMQIDVPEAGPAEPAHCHALPAGRHL